MTVTAMPGTMPSAIKPDINQDAIDMLEAVLQQARDGKLNAVTVVASGPNLNFHQCEHKTVSDCMLMMGGLNMARRELEEAVQLIF